MANTVAHSSLHTSSEHASAAACSAFCYDIGKDVWILPIIVAIRELGQIQRQVVLAHIVKGADHATLEQTPECFNVVRVNVPPHILFPGMVHDLMRNASSASRLNGILKNESPSSSSQSPPHTAIHIDSRPRRHGVGGPLATAYSASDARRQSHRMLYSLRTNPSQSLKDQAP